MSRIHVQDVRASHAEIEIEATIQYIIEGIPDDENNKSILYGASTINELRKQLSQYETQRAAWSKARDRPAVLKPKKSNREYADAKTRCCYNCGDRDHIGKECPSKSKGLKCFLCEEFRHAAAKCHKGTKTLTKTVSKASIEVTNANDKKTYKLVNVLGRDVEAVIDSGSDLHLARARLYVKLGAPKIDVETVPFRGIGTGEMRTLSSFIVDVRSDGLAVELRIHIVPDSMLKHDLLLSGELSDFAEIRLRKRQATLEPLNNQASRDASSDAGWREILNIDVGNEAEIPVDLQHVSDTRIRLRLEKMIEDYQPVQTANSGVKMRIVLKEETPVYQNPRRLSHTQRKIVNDVIADWEARGIVRPSISEYASPIVLTTKRNGQPRLCVNYREINRKIIRDRYPLLLIEDQLDRLQEAVVFSTLDLKDGFFHVPIEEDSIKYTAFIVLNGHYKFLHLPFRLSNSPAVFQRHVRVIFQELIKTGVVLTYLDDLIIPARTDEESIEKLQQVLDVASRHGLVINWKKCSLLVRRVEYLGHIIANGTVRPSSKS